MRPVYYLGIFIPTALALELAHASPLLVFGAAALGVIPTAAAMGEATEVIASKTGPGIGGLLNVTFGNAPELIIAFLALLEGLQEVVKASIVGSIIGNILLVLGAAMVVGGRNRDKQTFSATAANAQSGMLLLALAALILPAVFQLIHGGGLPGIGEERVKFGSDLEKLSLAVALVLIASYVAGLVFSLKTHRRVFNPFDDSEADEHAGWTMRRAVIQLTVAAVLVGLTSELLVGSVSEASKEIGLSEFFVGVFVVAIVGNAAEHWVAVLAAAKDKMDLAVNIAIGSSAQIALFVAPVLVLLSFVVGPNPLALVFNGYEIAAMLFAVLIANFATQEGETNWFEG
ncbi:MAG: calcium/proton exchanger, partial [Actinomycetota bacterium]|nr:calcium/proton exchanger [Actinomycetota bacterium]